MEKSKTCNRPWRYSLAMFGLSIAGYMYVTYGTFFYTETFGLSMKLIALGNVLYAVWDAFNDPIAGYLSDRTRTRWGRRKPWALVSSACVRAFVHPVFQPARHPWARAWGWPYISRYF